MINKNDFKSNFDLTEEKYQKIEQGYDILAKKAQMKAKIMELRRADELAKSAIFSGGNVAPLGKAELNKNGPILAYGPKNSRNQVDFSFAP